ncbi:hypothetical protein [Neorhizobium sp. DAR64872/K0K18]|uniref:hypothetical protein n=1 Tax=Neorhizobium sp. DAR64872/K0K18 TaxID=3421958 RepID=UPI003D2C779C
MALAVAIWSVASNTARDEERRNRHTEHYALTSQQRIKTDCLNREVVAMSQCISEIIQSSNEEKRNEADLQAQKGMDRWAFWMLVVSTFSAVVTSVGVIYVALTLREARATTAAAIRSAVAADKTLIEAEKATKHAELSVTLASEALIATDRAWIKITCDAMTDLIFEEDIISLSVQYTYENIGDSPAINVTIFQPEIFTDASKAIERLDEHVETCDRTQKYNSVINSGIPMFPDQAVSEPFHFVLDTDEFAARIEEIDQYQRDDAVGRGTLAPTVLLFATYRLPGDEKNRITGVMFSLRWVGLDGVAFDAKPKIVAKDMVDLSSTGFGSRLS